MKIGIIEDEAVHMQILNRYIKNWGVERKENIQIKEYDSAESFLFAWDDEKDFDILFIDIQMKKMDGIKMAKRIRESNNNIALVFTTGVAEYISEGYEVEALHYLIKPIKEEKVVQCLERAAKRKADTEYIIFRGGDGVYKFSKRKIIYVEADGHNTLFRVSEGEESVTYTVIEAVKSVEKKLAGENFIKCHRSYICNLEFIHSIGKNEILFDDGSKIPVSRRAYSVVNEAFINYYRRIEDDR